MGNTPLYLSNNVFKSTPSSKLTKDKEFGIDGFIIKEKILKSRTNQAGREVQLLYDQKYGIDRLLTNYLMLKENGLVRGQGWYYLEGMPEYKFQQKGFKSKLEDNIKMREGFRDLVNYCGELYLSGKKDDDKLFNIDSEQDMEKALFDSFEDNDFIDII